MKQGPGSRSAIPTSSSEDFAEEPPVADDRRGYGFLPSEQEAEEQACELEADAKRLERAHPQIADDLRRNADRLRHPAGI